LSCARTLLSSRGRVRRTAGRDLAHDAARSPTEARCALVLVLGQQLHCRCHRSIGPCTTSINTVTRTATDSWHSARRRCGGTTSGVHRSCLHRMHRCTAPVSSTPTTVPSRTNQTPLAIMVMQSGAERSGGADPHPRTDAPTPMHAYAARHEPLARVRLSVARAVRGCMRCEPPSPIGRCSSLWPSWPACGCPPIHCTVAGGHMHMLVLCACMPCNARTRRSNGHNTIYNRSGCGLT
jgi:hypothetical protein